VRYYREKGFAEKPLNFLQKQLTFPKKDKIYLGRGPLTLFNVHKNLFYIKQQSFLK